jgi:hypothetical protein
MPDVQQPNMIGGRRMEKRNAIFSKLYFFHLYNSVHRFGNFFNYSSSFYFQLIIPLRSIHHHFSISIHHMDALSSPWLATHGPIRAAPPNPSLITNHRQHHCRHSSP